MPYKLSKFNLVVQEDENYLIFNSLKNSFMKISNFDYKTIESFCSNNEEIEQNNTIEKLIELGVICKKDDDEDKKAFLKSLSIIKNRVLRLIIMPTMNCNFRCVYCYEEHDTYTMNETNENAIISFVKKNITSYEILKISWFGGEPTLALNLLWYYCIMI